VREDICSLYIPTLLTYMHLRTVPEMWRSCETPSSERSNVLYITRLIDHNFYLKIKLYQIISTVKQKHFKAVNVVEVARTGIIGIYAD
jgi:hypothetical protein